MMPAQLEGIDRARALFAEGRPASARYALTSGGQDQLSSAGASTAGRILIGRLVRQLGAPRLGTAMLVRAWRQAPRDPEACYHQARTLLALRGADAAWHFLAQRGLLEDAHPDLVADWISLAGFVRAQLGDFAGAWNWLERAQALRQQSSWLAVERSFVLELEDRFDEALIEAQRATALDSRSRSAMQQFSALLLAADRPDEARSILQSATRRIESADLCIQLAMAKQELGWHRAALAEVRRARLLMPLLEAEQGRWLDGLESHARYLADDVPGSIRLARRSGGDFQTRVARAMEQSAGTDSSRSDRVRLLVPFVRQRRLACAPAAAAMLGRFWGLRVDARAIENEVCDGGTTPRAIRAWAEKRGLLARELTVDLAVALELLDRGLPFALTTIDEASAHMQIIIGYDRCRQTLLVRDPARPEVGEIHWQELAERGRPPGPRGLLMAPVERARELASIELPESGLYDCLHDVQQSLHQDDLPAARVAASRLATCAPGHPLEILARSCLGFAEDKPESVLACIEEMLTGYPDRVEWILRRIEKLLPP